LQQNSSRMALAGKSSFIFGNAKCILASAMCNAAFVYPCQQIQALFFVYFRK
jgi:hypothetical protein